MDTSEIHKGSVNAQKMVNLFVLPIADGKVKLSGGNQVWRTSTLTQDSPERGQERKDDLRGNSDGSQPKDTRMDDRDARNDFWSRLTFIVITSNLEFSSTCRRRNHSQHHCDTLTWSGEYIRPWMCWNKAVQMIIGTLIRIETCRNHGPVHAVHNIKMTNLLTGTCGPGSG